MMSHKTVDKKIEELFLFVRQSDSISAACSNQSDPISTACPTQWSNTVLLNLLFLSFHFSLIWPKINVWVIQYIWWVILYFVVFLFSISVSTKFLSSSWSIFSIFCIFFILSSLKSISDDVIWFYHSLMTSSGSITHWWLILWLPFHFQMNLRGVGFFDWIDAAWNLFLLDRLDLWRH